MTTTAWSSRFEALGAYLPPAVLPTPDVVAQMTGVLEVNLQWSTGAAERRVYGPRPEAAEDCSYGVAVKAALDCLGNSRYEAAEQEFGHTPGIDQPTGLQRRTGWGEEIGDVQAFVRKVR